MKSKLLYFLFIFLAKQAFAQNNNVPIGSWQSFLPNNRSVGLATDGSKMFVASQYGFYSYDMLAKEYTIYSKVNGMSDVEMSAIAYDEINDMVVLAYNNSNIDLYKDNNFYNIPFIKLRNIAGDKSIYNIHTKDGFAYLSTGLGVVVLNLSRREIKETFVFYRGTSTAAVQGFSSDDRFFYAAGNSGLYKTAQNNPNIQASSTWKKLDSTRSFTQLSSKGNLTFVGTQDSIFAIQGDSLKFVFSKNGYRLSHLDPSEKGIVASFTNNADGYLYFFDSTLALTDSAKAALPRQVCISADQSIWVADALTGLRKGADPMSPNSIFGASTFDILPHDGKLYVAHGAYGDKWDVRLMRDGVSVFENGAWKTYNTYLFSPFNNLIDAVRLAVDPKDNTLYIASLLEGLFFLKKDNTAGQIKEGVIEPHLVDPGSYRVSSVVFDKDQNLWLSQHNAAHELLARSAQDGTWYKFALPFARPRPAYSNAAAGLIIDDNNLKWFFSPGGGGVLVYDDKGTLENPNDDEYARLVSGKGQGNLPDNNVNCIVNDKKGNIWIGTTNGIGIVNCPNRVIARTCEAEIRVVQYDNFAGELFAGENVKAIAVDGANRKWVGTGNGIWLISEDAGSIISRYTEDNSPLPSNNIQTIKIDPISGEVYIGTDKGMVSYRGTATDGGENNKDVLIFPNPVNKDYGGTIAIRGLVDNADVRITDISGQMIFRTKALGGQAIWNGRDYTGRKPQSGVFLVFATNNLGTERFAGKIIFVH